MTGNAVAGQCSREEKMFSPTRPPRSGKRRIHTARVVVRNHPEKNGRETKDREEDFFPTREESFLLFLSSNKSTTFFLLMRI